MSARRFNRSWSFNSMGYWTRYIFCTIVVTMVLISTSDAQPGLTMWNLDLDDNKIILEFGAPTAINPVSLLNPANNGMPINCTAILIGPVAGDIGMAVRLPPSVIGLQVDDTMATCDLGMEFRSILNINPGLGTDPYNTFLYYESIDGSGYDSIDGSGMNLLVDSSDIPYSNTVGTAATQVVPDSISPAMAGFEYLDLDEGVIVFSFTQPVNITNFNFTDLSLQNSPVDEETSIHVFLTDGSCESGCEIGRYITFRMAQADLERLKLEEGICVSISTCYPHHTNLLVADFGGNLITTYRFGLNYLMKHLILDTTPALLVGCDLNLSLDNLILFFDEPINVASYNPLGITLQFSENITLTSSSLVREPSSSVVVVDLGLDADKLKILTPAILDYDIYVSLISSSFEDIAGNSVQPVLRACNFTNDTYSPRVLSFDLDLDSNLLQVRFSEPVLAESLNISGFKLTDSSNATMAMYTISLNDSIVLDSDGLPIDGAVRTIYIIFGSQSLTRLKTGNIRNDIGTAVDNTYLLIDDHSFVDTNSNSFISPGPIAAAAIIADDSPATAIGFSLDMNIGQIVLTFNDVVDVSTWRNREMSIQGAALTYDYAYGYTFALSAIVSSDNSNVIILDLNTYELDHLKEQLNYGIAVNLSTTYLTIRAHAIDDIRGIDIIAVTDGNGIIANTYVRDSEPPQLISFDLYMNYGQVHFYFDESIARNSFIPGLFALQGDSMINTSSSSVNLSSNSTYNYCYSRHCYYYLPTDILHSLRRDPNIARDANTTYLLIMQGGVHDTSGNPIDMTGPIMVNYYSPGSIAAVSFGQSRYIVNEVDGSVQLLLILSNQLSIPVTVTIEVFNGLATGEDYALGPYSVTFPAGITITSLSISILDDNIFEGNENFIVMFNSSLLPSGVVLDDVNNQSTIIILDDESVVVDFMQSAYSATENNGFVQIELVSSNPSSSDITIEVLNAEASATDDDYDSEPFNVTISAGATTVAFNISINNDSLLESNEIFTLTIDPSSLPEDVTAGSLFRTTVTIVDISSATVNFTQSVYRVNESSRIVQIMLVLSNPSSVDITVEALNTDESATGGIDYSSGPYTTTFITGTTNALFDVTINDDNVYRGNVNFNISINPSSLPDNVIVGDTGQARVIIVDDDTAAFMVNFSQTTYSIDEDSGLVQPELVLSDSSLTSTTVHVFTTDGSATGQDYESGPYSVIFPAGVTRMTFDVSVISDDIFERNETFQLSIDSSSLPLNVSTAYPDQATVTIINDDFVVIYTVSFNQLVYNASEDSKIAQVTLVLDNPPSTDINIDVITIDGSAVGRGIDYGSEPYNVIFHAGETDVTLNISIIDDDILENDENFNVTVNPILLPIDVIIASNTGYSTVTILDNDAATLSFNQSTYSAIENSGLVEIFVTLSNPSSTDITVQIVNRDASATGEDYDSMSSYTVVFLAGMTIVPFNISIIDNSLFEGNESFILNINPDLLPDDVTIGDYGETTVTIIDDDEVFVSFDQSTYRVNQHDRLVQPVLNLSIPSSIDITVRVFSIDVTATGEDYGSGPYSVTFAAGITSTVLYISITDDDILEGAEYFNIMIDSSSLISGISVGSLDQATVEILDADGDTALPFLPFSSKRQQLGYYLDGVSDIIYIPNGFPFGLQTHTKAYVGTNGVISFSRPFYYWYPSPFPGYYYLRRFYVVAPYWADHDIRRDGEVYYEALIKGQNKNDDSVLNRVNHYIALNADPDFIGTFMILAEWQNVHPYPYGSNYYYYFQGYYPSIRTFTKQENTYQALVITDGKESYAIFTYMCGLIQWSGLWRYPTIGYNAGGVLFANHPLTAHEEANQIDCPNNSSRYVNIIYKISADPDTVKKLQSQCQSWYFSDIEYYGKSEDILTFSKSQIACPCTLLQAWWDRRYWSFTIKDNTFCFIEIFNNTYGGAQECCYSTSPQMFGSLVLQGRSSGGLLRYHPWWSWTINYPKYIEYDRNPQEICCLSAVGYCNLYHERRPVNNCEGYIPQRRTRGRGDPHITTLDGRTYTFNGLGEYVLLRENASNFEFQGRTELAPNSNATVFSAFAMRDGDNNVEVGTNVSTESFTINLDGADVSDSLISVGDNVTTSSSFIERSSNNSITVSFPSGVGITINYTAGLLVYTLEVPSSFEGTTFGLLGNYNNDDSDEFVFRNGTMISNSSSDREIHQFGQSWQITSVESIFTYKVGESVNTFSDPNHVPPFLDEILSSLMGNSTLTDVCGDNVECLFDFAQTGDVEVGMVAIAIENETAMETQEAFSFPPNITAPETFMATVGEESVYTFTVSSDSQNINVIILHEGEETLPSGVQLNNPDGDSYTITWTPADNTALLNITIVAADLNMKNISSIFNPVVQLCACENGGNCTTDGLLINDFSFIVLNCECLEGYDGEYCQNDADGCEIISCLEGQQCFDYPAPQVGAECVCPDGYVSDSDSKCVDINECVNRSTIDCTQQCINTPGSYECDCYDGYRAITANATQCEDIDECEEYNDCHQMCTNTEGSYYCSCNTGFVLATDSISCEAVAPCTMNNCSQSCANINGKETCFCMAGYQLGIDNVSCLDIDECVQTPCEQNCINTISSFTCSCNNGYELDENGRSCNDIDECLSGPCPSDLMCNNMDGNYSCDCPDGTVSNGTDCTLIRNVTPSRLFTTPPPTTAEMLPTISVTSSPTVPLAPEGEKLTDGLPIGAIVGIIVGGLVIMLITVLIIYIVARKINSKPRKRNRLLDSNKNDWPLEMLSSGSDPINY